MRLLLAFLSASVAASALAVRVPVTDANIVLSPYNWFRSGSDFVQIPNRESK